MASKGAKGMMRFRDVDLECIGCDHSPRRRFNGHLPERYRLEYSTAALASKDRMFLGLFSGTIRRAPHCGR